MIEYKLEKNELTADPNDYRAVVVNVRSYTEDDLIARMLESGAGITRSDILSVNAAYKQAVLSIVREGGVINGDLYNMSFTMPGTYNPLDEAHHKVEVHLHPSHELRDAAAHLKVKRVAGSGKEPVITAVQDVNTNAIDTISNGGVFVVKGHKIKIIGAHADAGLYLKNTATGAVTKFAGHLAENTPSKLMLQAPALPAGVYHLTIKTQYSSSNGELKEPRTLEYPNSLTVV